MLCLERANQQPLVIVQLAGVESECNVRRRDMGKLGLACKRKEVALVKKDNQQ